MSELSLAFLNRPMDDSPIGKLNQLQRAMSKVHTTNADVGVFHELSAAVRAEQDVNDKIDAQIAVMEKRFQNVG